MKRWFPAGLFAVAMLVLPACSDDGGGASGERAAAQPGDAQLPAGYRWAEHPDAVVAVPEDWVRVDDPQLERLGPDAVRFAPPDVPEDLALGVTLWRWTEPVTFIQEPASALVSIWSGTPGFDVARREPFEVGGADEGFIIEGTGEAHGMEGSPSVAIVYASARADDRVVVLDLLATEEVMSPEDVEVALETFRMTGG